MRLFHPQVVASACLLVLAVLPTKGSRADCTFGSVLTAQQTVRTDGFVFLNYPCHQGIAWGNGQFYSSHGGCLAFDDEFFVFDSSWNQQSQHQASYAGRPTCLLTHAHVGDPAVGPDGFLYAPISDFNAATKCADEYHLARYDGNDLSFDRFWNVRSLLKLPNCDQGGGSDFAGLYFYENELWAIEWRKDHRRAARIYRMHVVGNSLNLVATYRIDTPNANGLVLWNGTIFVTWGNMVDCGRLHLYEISQLREDRVNKPYGERTFDVSHPIPAEVPRDYLLFNHAEGLTLKGDELWVCAAVGQYVRKLEMPWVVPVSDPGGPYFGWRGAPITFDGTNSYTPNAGRSIQRYYWQFGDGFFDDGTETQPTHTFMTAGNYTLELWASDGGYLSGTGYADVNIGPNELPVPQPNGPYEGFSNFPVNFFSFGSDDEDGSIDAFLWDFGDGNTSSDEHPSHTYTADGLYTVKLTVTDNRGAPATQQTSANIGGAPLCHATAMGPVAPQLAFVDDDVTFDGSLSVDPDGTIQSYMWDFLDGNTATGVTVVHSFSNPGTYYVRLTVRDNANHETTCVVPVQISARPNATPVCDPGGPYLARPKESVDFDGSGSTDTDGEIVLYEWSFGDGDTATGEAVSHAYDRRGFYQASLCVTDNLGARACCTFTVIVNGFPECDAGGPYITRPGDTVQLDGSASVDIGGNVAHYEWELESGERFFESNPQTSFETVGDHNARLCVHDEDSQVSCCDALVRVLDPNTGFGFAQEPNAAVGRGTLLMALEDGPLLLASPHPNPMNPKTTLRYRLPETGAVNLKIHDLQGREVRVLVAGSREAGVHAETWDGRDSRGIRLASGVYLSVLEFKGERQVERVMLLR